MKIYKNNTKGPLRFGRFRLAVDEQVPAVPYTENEEKDIVRFVAMGILACVGEQDATPASVAEAPVDAASAEQVVEAPVDAAPAEPVAAPAQKRAAKTTKAV